MGAARLPAILEKISVSTDCNEKEMMIAAGARIIAEAALNRNRKWCFVAWAGGAGGIFSLLPVEEPWCPYLADGGERCF